MVYYSNWERLKLREKQNPSNLLNFADFKGLRLVALRESNPGLMAENHPSGPLTIAPNFKVYFSSFPTENWGARIRTSIAEPESRVLPLDDTPRICISQIIFRKT